MAKNNGLEQPAGDSGSELEKLLDELGSVIEALERDPQSDQAQCRVCLLTRSAYTEFYSVSEVEGEVNTDASERLQSHLEAALRILPASGKYHSSVTDRFLEFKQYCDETSRRNPFDTAVAP